MNEFDLLFQSSNPSPFTPRTHGSALLITCSLMVGPWIRGTEPTINLRRIAIWQTVVSSSETDSRWYTIMKSSTRIIYVLDIRISEVCIDSAMENVHHGSAVQIVVDKFGCELRFELVRFHSQVHEN
jgi:hypothetical protein